MRSTDGGAVTQNFTSGANTGQLAQSGNNFFFVNYAAGGVTSFSQTGAGQIRFVANSVNVLTISGTGIGVSGTITSAGITVTGNITSTGTAHSFAAKSIAASAINGMPTASTVAGAALATVGAIGTSTDYARADHTHPTPAMPAASTAAGAALAAAGAVGVSAAYARADHTHPFPTAANVGALPIAGGTLTGALTAPGVTVNGNITSTGTAHGFAAHSIPASAIKDLPISVQVITQAAYDALSIKNATTLYLISG
jgi:hypothetical protein